MPRPRSPRFAQLDRLADQEEWRDWQRHGPWKKHRAATNRRGAALAVPLDAIYRTDGVLSQDEDC